MSIASRRADAWSIAKAALRAVDPRRAVRDDLLRHPLAEGPWRLVAVGKAAGPMVQGALDVLGDRVVGGVVVSHAPVPALPRRLQVLQGDHPVPGPHSLAAGEALLAEAAGHGADDQVLALISGGASALAESTTLPWDELVAGTRVRLARGDDIATLNAWRTAHSRLKGGKLRAASSARFLTLVVSDVLGDDPAVVGSGPTVADDAPARVVLDRRALLAEAEREAWALRYATTVLSDQVRGEAEREGQRLAMATGLQLPGAPPMALLAVGEPVVSEVGDRPGGRMQHAALAAAEGIAGTGAVVLCIGSDGRDGPTEAAGALVDGSTWGRLQSQGIDGRDALRRRDATRALDAVGALLRTGPTHTNVGDLMVGLC
jgi:glycerate-2-kinase